MALLETETLYFTIHVVRYIRCIAVTANVICLATMSNSKKFYLILSYLIVSYMQHEAWKM